MIRLERAQLPSDTATYLKVYTELVEQASEADRKETAADLWTHTTVRRRVRDGLMVTLADMAPGHQRCMYCGDSQGTDIDHFEPKSLAPLRTFEWLNHLLACAYCNSNQKRNSFPRSEADGSPLLIDPTLQDPLEHLRLVLPVCTYKGLTPQGDACIAVFGLNSRGVLVDGRRTAYGTAKQSVELWRIATDRGQHDKAAEIVRLAWNRPLADVLAGMFHQAYHHAAALLFVGEEETLGLLRDRDLRAAFLSRA
ncbi:HNH endonuclease [Streptomyces sp. CA-278952]|uniref:HNH endonuclease n=1 Tax=Streptomyces sp. CA-278952 TaxID=2980556 RepID=UPI002368A1F0|nr:HNH endonuclease [Streptomyces sp. CA-278952]WDG31194.1 HNH endonuclease [Streptomyces sp. CA-278952]